jgi:hypothetical protein
VVDVFWVSDYIGNFYDEAEMGLEARNDERFAKCCCVPTIRDDVGTSSHWYAY